MSTAGARQLIQVMKPLVRLVGLAHDIGKATFLFQNKLANASFPQKDPVRHEWVSMKVLERVLQGHPLEDSFKSLDTKRLEARTFNIQGIKSLEQLVLFVVASHHMLLESDDQYGLDARGFVRAVQDHPYHDDPARFLALQPGLYKTLEAEIREAFMELEQLCPSPNPKQLRALALIARSFLIAADHTVSARQVQHNEDTLFANSLRAETAGKKPKKRDLNQSLSYHLKEVSALAVDLAEGSWSHQWPGLNQATIAFIEGRAPNHSRFDWQNRVFDSLVAARCRSTAPALVLNVAGTGSGKTRLNAKAICALNQRSQVRFSCALNLRTLTLQTGHVYETELAISSEQLAVVIGDRIIRKLHSNENDLSSNADSGIDTNADENPDELAFEANRDAPFKPEWMREYLALDERSAALITQPVLVSTIDYLIAAGEPHRQGHHVSALARVANADLILDEIDDYDPKAFVAVLRLVEMAALHGANVVCSSATLPFPMAKQLAIAFASGVQMRSQLVGGDGRFLAALVDHLQPADVWETVEPESLDQRYRAFVKKSLPLGLGHYHKIPALIRFDPSPTAFLEAVLESVKALHQTFEWSYGDSGKQVSFGLVRVANIYVAVELCRFLSANLPQAYVAAYHSLDFVIQRYRKEKILDEILSRKNGNAQLETHPYIRELVSKSQANSIPFLVIATPVEEVGRDHDFDWGILEPSSMRSLVQAGGRVNRHRLIQVTRPNIHILQWNYKHCEGKSAAFIHPGFEDKNEPWAEHDMGELVAWSKHDELTAAVRFTRHPMTDLEDIAIEKKIAMPMKCLTLTLLSGRWMTDHFYNAYPLRERRRSIDLFLNSDQFYVLDKGLLGPVKSPQNDLVSRTNPVDNHWLAWDTDELVRYCEQKGVLPEEGLRLKIDVYAKYHFLWDRSFGFQISR